MATQRFPLEPGGPERLSITSGGFAFSKATIALDGRPLFTDLTPKQVEDGVSTVLPDGSTLSIRKVNTGFLKAYQTGLELKRNGLPIPGSIGTPEHAIKTAKGAGVFLYVLAGLNLAFGLFVQLARNDPFFGGDQGGWPFFFSAFLLAALGFFVHRKLSLIALGIAMAYMLVDGFMAILAQAEAGRGPWPGAFVMRVLFVIILLGAFKVIRRYKLAQRAA